MLLQRRTSSRTKADINRPTTEPVLEKDLDQDSTAQDVNEYSSGDFDPPATQPVFNESERTVLETNVEKGFQTQDGQLDIQDVQQNHLNKPDKPVINTIDNASDGNNFAQESTDESQFAWEQEQGPQTDSTRLSEGPSSSNNDYSAGVDTEGTQQADRYAATSQENDTEGEPDEIPVYTLSFPKSEESFATEESTTSPSFTAPTSSDATPSATYGETLTLPDGESSFSAIDAPSQDDQPTTERSE